MTIPVQHEPERRRFVAAVDGTESVLLYAPLGEKRVDFRSTFVDPAVRNRGVGEAIVRVAVEWARANDFEIVPSCWFVERWLERESAREARREGSAVHPPEKSEGSR